jgi:RND family efflux transporter MFP subunit
MRSLVPHPLLGASVAALLLYASPSPALAQSAGLRGLTEPVADVVLSASVAGIIATVHRGEGDYVAEGETILELDKRAEELEVERRRVLKETLKGEMDRTELLFKTTNSVPREEVERKRGEYEIASVEWEIAREQLSRRVLRAPFSGIVTDLPIKPGEACQPQQQLVRLVDVSQFYWVSNVDPAVASRLRLGQTVDLEVQDGTSSARLAGEIVFVSPVVDSASGLMRIRARFANPEGRVRPGVAGRLLLPEVAHVN